MIDRFGRVMVYVDNPGLVADFFVRKIGFVKGKVYETETGIVSVEVATSNARIRALSFSQEALLPKYPLS